MNTTKKIKQKIQAGFTLVELLIVLGVIAILSAVAFNTGDSVRSSVVHDQVRQELNSLFPIAVQACLARSRTKVLGACTATRISAISPLNSAATPCGDNWEAVATDNNIVVTYKLDGCPDAAAFATDLAAELTELDKIGAVPTTTADAELVTVTYSK